ncbi:TetR/AcrR family transcriptional regulator [Ancylobacter sp. IITR112]|uniref:TetR/AcrR family transcriptional regulator n=1 Tax=Ancylobacter sp. IITR112 TaxID=3138073 RepID=UPI00352A073F
MPKIAIDARPDDTTRERILKAAMLRFSTHSYEETGLRDLAADVGVDSAYVHRCFGSKEKLFYEAVKATLQPERIFAGEASDLSFTLAKEVMVERGANEIRPLDIVIRSFSSPDASRVLRDLLMEDFIAPLTKKRRSLSPQGAALIGAFLAGVGILRDVIRADPLMEGEGGEVEKIIARTISGLMSGDPNDRQEVPVRPVAENRPRQRRPQ